MVEVYRSSPNSTIRGGLDHLKEGPHYSRDAFIRGFVRLDLHASQFNCCTRTYALFPRFPPLSLPVTGMEIEDDGPLDRFRPASSACARLVARHLR